jgi:EAL domain-containing protein (putative c-di-GMP-specific phosphodiesterase class I)
MVHRSRNKLRNFLNWGKIVFPLSSIRYYPPQFILRDPIIQGAKRAFRKGSEVAVAVFTIKNLREISDQLGQTGYSAYISSIKKEFCSTIQHELKEEEVILLHDHYSDGLTLFIEVGHERYCISEIEGIMKKILRESERKLLLSHPAVNPQIETGYMFIEKKHYSIEEAVLKAHQQALAMAEKRVQSDFNEMLYSMSKIVAQKEIRLLAQPILDVATKEVKAWEMLTRGPEGTPLENPLQLFSVARQTGMLYDLEMIVMEKIIEQIEMTGCQQDIFINFTPITLGNQLFVRDMKKLLNRHKGISPRRMTIEVTERDSIEGMEYFIYNIKVLRTLGFRIAIDDTGAGYASLNSITEIMPDIIKIDRSVIQNIDKNTVKESMLKGLLLVAKETGSLVVAEGIESEEEAIVLFRNKVDLAQGYFYARPDLLQNGLLSS